VTQRLNFGGLTARTKRVISKRQETAANQDWQYQRKERKTEIAAVFSTHLAAHDPQQEPKHNKADVGKCHEPQPRFSHSVNPHPPWSRAVRTKFSSQTDSDERAWSHDGWGRISHGPMLVESTVTMSNQLSMGQSARATHA